MVIFKFQMKNLNLMSTNRRHKSNPLYINVKEYLRDLFLIHKNNGTYEKECSMELILSTRKDIDNCLKVIQDALQLAKIIKDDSQIIHEEIYLFRPKLKGEKDKFILELKSVDTNLIKKFQEKKKKLNGIRTISLWERL